MGEEIQKHHFSDAEFLEFQKRLTEETFRLREYFLQNTSDPEALQTGFELETWLVDQKFRPCPKNQEVLENLQDPMVVSELSRFNLEINSPPHPVENNLLQKLAEDLNGIWRKCVHSAHRYSAEMLMIGTLPTLREEMLNLGNISPLERFYALNEQVLRQRDGKNLVLDIQGRDALHLSHSDVMLESAGTSLQIHLQIPVQHAARYFNAALILAAPLVALAANSPFLFGKELWEETRIPLFEQSVDLWSFSPTLRQNLPRVNFGSGYVDQSMAEFFQENLETYPVLLPILFDDPPEKFSHLRLHNGTIWRWVRPLVGLNADGKPHLRLEQRVAASGPSVPDVIANVAFFLGTIQYLATCKIPPETQLPFTCAKDNFYCAAHEGLKAPAQWLDGQEHSMQALCSGPLLDWARQGLTALKINPDEISYYLDQVLRPRIDKAWTGAQWQRGFIHKYGKDFGSLTAAYFAKQSRALPVCDWKLN